MPAELEACVAHLMADPDFQPQEGRTKEESAFAVCQSRLGAQGQGQPLVKDIVIARVGRNFKNGDDEFDLTKGDIDEAIGNFKRLKRHVPILLEDEHLFGAEHSKVPARGWVEDMWRNGDDWIARAKFNADLAAAVLGDQYRGVSIGVMYMKDEHGKPVGQVLDHLLVTNSPLFNLPSIAASSTGEGLFYIAATRRKQMAADPNQTKEPDKKGKDAVAPDGPVAAALKKQEEEIVIPLKAENLRLKEQVETLEARVANAGADEEKEKLAIENVNLRKDIFAMKVRALCDQGLKSGTLKAAWCDGYAGKGAVDFDGTVRWLRASRFYDETVPNAEDNAFRLLKWAAENNPPLYKMNARFSSGVPQAAGSTPLTEEQRQGIRKLGLDPERISAMTDATDYEEWKKHKAAQAGTRS